ncbi:hypothetical protein LPJ75_003209, partial [Coemansia sp. RSA 2598]
MNGRNKLRPGAHNDATKSGADIQDNDADGSARITEAIAAMCGDFGQNGSRQRTASWVSSELSSTKDAQSEDQKPLAAAGESADNEDTAEDSRRQHVRLTTIDPITASISDAIRSYRMSIDSRGASSDLDP